MIMTIVRYKDGSFQKIKVDGAATAEEARQTVFRHLPNQLAVALAIVPKPEIQAEPELA